MCIVFHNVHDTRIIYCRGLKNLNVLLSLYILMKCDRHSVISFKPPTYQGEGQEIDYSSASYVHTINISND